MKIRLFLFSAILATAAPTQAAVTYTFQAISSFKGVTGGFTFTSPDYISGTVFTNFANTSFCYVSIGSCASYQWFTSNNTIINPHRPDDKDVVSLMYTTDGGLTINAAGAFYFANGAFLSDGVYSTVEFGAFQSGMLSVVSTAPAPEPASWTMMVGGFGMVGAALRRRKVSYSGPAKLSWARHL